RFDELAIVMHGDEHDLGRRPARLQLLRGGNAGEPRHGDVEDEQIGLESRRIGNDRESIGDGSHDVVLAREQAYEVLEHRSMINGDQYTCPTQSEVSMILRGRHQPRSAFWHRRYGAATANSDSDRKPRNVPKSGGNCVWIDQATMPCFTAY